MVGVNDQTKQYVKRRERRSIYINSLLKLLMVHRILAGPLKRNNRIFSKEIQNKRKEYKCSSSFPILVRYKVLIANLATGFLSAKIETEIHTAEGNVVFLAIFVKDQCIPINKHSIFCN